MQRQDINDALQQLHDIGAAKEAKKLWNKYTKHMQYMYYPIK